MTGPGSVGSVSLSPSQRAALDAGRSVRVELPAPIKIGPWISVQSALVVRAGGRVRAYANVCRHQAVPLDMVWSEPSEVDAPTTDDGAFLICVRHGALYRPLDGVCVSGPCVGDALHELVVRESGADAGGGEDEIVLKLELLSR